MVLNFWMPLWAETLEYPDGVAIEEIVKIIERAQYSSSPYYVFLAIQATGWFLGGVVAAKLAKSSLILHSIGVAVVGTTIFLNPLYTAVCGLVAAIGGAVVVRRKSNHSAQPTR